MFLHPTTNGLVRGTFHFPLDMNPTSDFTHGLPLELNPIALQQELGFPVDTRLYFGFLSHAFVRLASQE